MMGFDLHAIYKDPQLNNWRHWYHNPDFKCAWIPNVDAPGKVATASATNFFRFSLAHAYHKSQRAEAQLNKVEANKEDPYEKRRKRCGGGGDKHATEELGKVMA